MQIFANLHWQPFSPVCLGADRENVSERTAEPRKQGTANQHRSTQLTANHIPFLSEIGIKVDGCVSELYTVTELQATLNIIIQINK